MIIIEKLAIADEQKRRVAPRIALASYVGAWDTGAVLSLNQPQIHKPNVNKGTHANSRSLIYGVHLVQSYWAVYGLDDELVTASHALREEIGESW